MQQPLVAGRIPADWMSQIEAIQQETGQCQSEVVREAIAMGSNAKLWGFLNKNGTFSIVMRMLSLAQQLPTTFSVLLKDFVYM